MVIRECFKEGDKGFEGMKYSMQLIVLELGTKWYQFRRKYRIRKLWKLWKEEYQNK